MFYKATVQAILLFGSETWNITPSLIKSLEGFHIRAAYHMVSKHKPVRHPDGFYAYPDSLKVLEEAGLYCIAHYMEVRRQTISEFIVNRPIFDFCREGKRQRGTCPR